MPVNPLDLTDLIKISILIVKGSQPTGSVARTVLISTFDASPAFPGRQKRYSGTASDVDAALAADGFTTPYTAGDPLSKARAQAAAFFDNELPVDEVVIGRRDAADLTYGATLAAIAAEDNTFCLVGAETRTKAQQQQIAVFCESRWNFYRTLTREPGTLTKAAGTFADAAFLAKYNHTSATYYDAEVATGYGPAEILGGAGTFVVENNWKLNLKYNGGALQTFTFVSTAATSLGSAQVSAINLADGDDIEVEVDALGPLVITFVDDPAYFPDGIAAATAAQVVEFLNDTAPQLTWSVATGAVRATSQRTGTDSLIDITGGTASTKLGLSGQQNGTGDFAFADAAEAAELATKINATATGFTANAIGTRLQLVSNDSGEAIFIEILEGEVNDNLGLETGLYYGTGVQEDWHDCAVLGVLAQLATRLDTPGGSFPLDNQKLRGRPGQKLTTTERKNVFEQFCDTYEPRTQNFPGELHFGVTFSGVNTQFVISLLWLQLRLSEAIKGLQDNLAAQKKTIPYAPEGIDTIDNAITGVITRWAASGAILPADLTPYDPLLKVTGYKKPTIAEQSEGNRAAGKVSGWRTTQLDAGSIKAVEVEIIGSTQ